ncbi:MAG: cytochrome P450 [Ilumatobacteraceae bacterium]|nr:cytochrome P450 [Ilumatobacteraceae bacterium]
MTTYDPFDAGVLADPYPAYAAARATEGLAHEPLLDTWLVSRYDDVVAVLRQARLYSSARGMGDLAAMAFSGDEQRLAPRLLILEDPPVHTTLRRLVARGFTPSRILDSAPMVQAIADRHVAELLEHGTDGELVRDLAVPFPVRVIAELLGIPPSRFAEFRGWSEAIMKAFSITPDPAGGNAAIEAINEFFAEVIDERRSNPGDDLVSLLVRRGGEGEDPLTLDELVSFCILLLIAGNETTTNLLGNALLVLLERPDLEAALRADPALIAPFVEEVLRYDSPVQSLFRGLSEPATLAGVDLPEGARIMVLLGAANRDGAHYDAPDEVRLDRFATGTPDHVAFGSGVHLCLGAPLARLEAKVALTTLLAATSELRATGEPTRTASFLLRGCTSVPLHAVPA